MTSNSFHSDRMRQVRRDMLMSEGKRERWSGKYLQKRIKLSDKLQYPQVTLLHIIGAERELTVFYFGFFSYQLSALRNDVSIQFVAVPRT